MSTYTNTKLHVQEVCINLPPMAAKRHPAENVEVGNRINILLAALDWPATQLAAAIHITPQKLNNYTSGRNKLPPTTATAICVTTGVDFDYLHRGSLDRLPDDLRAKIIKARKVAA